MQLSVGDCVGVSGWLCCWFLIQDFSLWLLSTALAHTRANGITFGASFPFFSTFGTWSYTSCFIFCWVPQIPFACSSSNHDHYYWRHFSTSSRTRSCVDHAYRWHWLGSSGSLARAFQRCFTYKVTIAIHIHTQCYKILNSIIDMLISNGSSQKWMNKVDLTSLLKDTSILAFKLPRMEPLPIVNGHLMLKPQVLLATLVSEGMDGWMA